jgi:hypothetical protein
MISLHLGHSISVSSSDSMGFSSACSRRGSSLVSSICFSGMTLRVASLVRTCLDIAILRKFIIYVPADHGGTGELGKLPYHTTIPLLAVVDINKSILANKEDDPHD